MSLTELSTIQNFFQVEGDFYEQQKETAKLLICEFGTEIKMKLRVSQQHFCYIGNEKV